MSLHFRVDRQSSSLRDRKNSLRGSVLAVLTTGAIGSNACLCGTRLRLRADWRLVLYGSQQLRPRGASRIAVHAELSRVLNRRELCAYTACRQVGTLMAPRLNGGNARAVRSEMRWVCIDGRMPRMACEAIRRRKKLELDARRVLRTYVDPPVG